MQAAVVKSVSNISIEQTSTLIDLKFANGVIETTPDHLFYSAQQGWVPAGRQGAFNEAKVKNGIPKSQQPDEILPNLDRRGNPQPGREYVFNKGKKMKFVLEMMRVVMILD